MERNLISFGSVLLGARQVFMGRVSMCFCAWIQSLRLVLERLMHEFGAQSVLLLFLWK